VGTQVTNTANITIQRRPRGRLPARSAFIAQFDRWWGRQRRLCRQSVDQHGGTRPPAGWSAVKAASGTDAGVVECRRTAASAGGRVGLSGGIFAVGILAPQSSAGAVANGGFSSAATYFDLGPESERHGSGDAGAAASAQNVTVVNNFRGQDRDCGRHGLRHLGAIGRWWVAAMASPSGGLAHDQRRREVYVRRRRPSESAVRLCWASRFCVQNFGAETRTKGCELGRHPGAVGRGGGGAGGFLRIAVGGSSNSTATPWGGQGKGGDDGKGRGSQRWHHSYDAGEFGRRSGAVGRRAAAMAGSASRRGVDRTVDGLQNSRRGQGGEPGGNAGTVKADQRRGRSDHPKPTPALDVRRHSGARSIAAAWQTRLQHRRLAGQRLQWRVLECGGAEQAAVTR